MFFNKGRRYILGIRSYKKKLNLFKNIKIYLKTKMMSSFVGSHGMSNGCGNIKLSFKEELLLKVISIVKGIPFFLFNGQALFG